MTSRLHARLPYKDPHGIANNNHTEERTTSGIRIGNQDIKGNLNPAVLQNIWDSFES